METCYMCNAPATGKEHVPPKCIFPEDQAHRKNLIKVPSCDEHNSAKSKADEYLKFILTAVGGMNELAASIFQGSVMRSFEYNPHLVECFTPGLQPVRIGSDETGGFKLDWERFQSSMASVVRGLFFHQTGQKLTQVISGAAWEQMLTDDYSNAPFLKAIRMAEQEQNFALAGDNPRVFQFAFGKSKSGRTSFCRLRFYEGHPIYVTWNENSPAL